MDKALALAPTDGDLLFGRGSILADLNRPKEALDYYDRALASYPADDMPHRTIVRGEQASALKDAGRYEEADAAYAQVLQLDPNDPAYWNNRADNERAWGLACGALGQLDETERHWRRGLSYAEEAVRLNPNHKLFTALRDFLRRALGDQ
jgi:tetratricopeptide (TPR) repeat protein